MENNENIITQKKFQPGYINGIFIFIKDHGTIIRKLYNFEIKDEYINNLYNAIENTGGSAFIHEGNFVVVKRKGELIFSVICHLEENEIVIERILQLLVNATVEIFKTENLTLDLSIKCHEMLSLLVDRIVDDRGIPLETDQISLIESIPKSVSKNDLNLADHAISTAIRTAKHFQGQIFKGF